MRWIRVTHGDNIPWREGRAVSLDGREIAIFNLGSAPPDAVDRFVAVDNQCPHKRGPLADGIVAGASVVCPLHAWKISLVDGRVERPSGSSGPGVRTYPVRVEDGVVLVGLPEAAAAVGKDGMNLQNCLSDYAFLQDRRLEPPCPGAGACVSSNADNSG